MKSLEFITEEETTLIMNMAACRTAPQNIAKALGYSTAEFMRKWIEKHSVVRTAYDDGLLLSDFKVLDKQRELAESGNITAAQIYLKETREKEIAQIRNKILFEDAN